MKRAFIFSLVLAFCALAAILMVVRRDGPKADMTPPPDARRTVRQRNFSTEASTPGRAAVARGVKHHAKPVLDFSKDGDEDEDDSRTPEEKTLAARIEKALDDENLEAAIACADAAQKCGVVEIRQAMVDTLGWFGEKALPELMPFLGDADEDVRKSAERELLMAVSSIEDEGGKIDVVELAMSVLKDEDTLEDISGEYIGVDEKLAVESLSRIIIGNGSKEGVAKAMETYEFVTGEEWTGKEAAERWIAENSSLFENQGGDGSDEI